MENDAIRKSGTYALFAVVLYFAFFWRLDGALLWRDEATTSCWGKEMAQANSLLPRVWDGEQLMVQGVKGHDFNENFLPAMQSWLQFYVAALSTKMFGANTFSARLPFALLGLLGIWLFYLVFKLLFGRKKWAILAAGACMLSFPYLHYTRQARYYALVLIVSTAIIYEVLRFFKSNKNANFTAVFLRLSLYGILLFHSNYFSFGLLWAGIAAGLIVLRDKKFTLIYLGATAVIFLFTIPFLLHFNGSFLGRTEMLNLAYVSDYWDWLLLNIGRANKLIPLLPFFVIGAAGIWYFRKKTPFLSKTASWGWLLVFTTLLLAAIINKSNAFLRYYLFIIPLIFLLSGIYTYWAYRLMGKTAALLFISAVLIYQAFGGAGNDSEAVVKRQFAADQSVNGPMIDFLRENVRNGESVMFIDNAKGMVAHFYLPGMKWYGILEANNPFNQPYKSKLPPAMFDNYPDIDWVVVWGKIGLPRRVEIGYDLIWNYRFGSDRQAQSVDKNLYTPEQYTITQAEAGMSGSLDYYDFYRRSNSAELE